MMHYTDIMHVREPNTVFGDAIFPQEPGVYQGGDVLQEERKKEIAMTHLQSPLHIIITEMMPYLNPYHCFLGNNDFFQSVVW